MSVNVFVAVSDVQEKVFFTVVLTNVNEKRNNTLNKRNTITGATLATRETLLTLYNDPMVALVGGMTLLTKKNRASSGRKCTRFLMRK